MQNVVKVCKLRILQSYQTLIITYPIFFPILPARASLYSSSYFCLSLSKYVLNSRERTKSEVILDVRFMPEILLLVSPRKSEWAGWFAWWGKREDRISVEMTLSQTQKKKKKASFILWIYSNLNNMRGVEWSGVAGRRRWSICLSNYLMAFIGFLPPSKTYL